MEITNIRHILCEQHAQSCTCMVGMTECLINRYHYSESVVLIVGGRVAHAHTSTPEDIDTHFHIKQSTINEVIKRYTIGRL